MAIPSRALSWIDPLARKDWDALLETFPNATFFHTAIWARILTETYSYTPRYAALGSTERPDALLPLMEVDSCLTGRRGLCLPFTDACAPLAQHPEQVTQLFEFARQLAADRRWDSIELRGGTTAFPDAPPSVTFHGHSLDLRPGEKALFAQCDAAVRRAIRKAENSGLTIDTSPSPDNLRAFVHLMALTRRRHGVPPQPKSFLANIYRHAITCGRGYWVIVRHQGQPIAAALFLHHRRTTLYKFGASDERHQNLRANNLAMWRAIQWHIAQGFETLDFGRTSLDNTGLRTFKLSWGATERSQGYLKFDCRRRKWVISRDRSSGWHTQFFRHIPLSLSRLIGSLLYRHIA